MSSGASAGPLFYQPDPEVRRWIVGKPERLERRAPSEYVIVGRTLDGRLAEARIVPMNLRMKGV